MLVSLMLVLGAVSGIVVVFVPMVAVGGGDRAKSFRIFAQVILVTNVSRPCSAWGGSDVSRGFVVASLLGRFRLHFLDGRSGRAAE